MKRAIAFVTALVIAAGAVAPAASVFAADLPAVPMNSDDLSIWDTSTSTPENPYNTTDVFNAVNDMWGDLFDDGRFNNATVSDFQRDAVERIITKYIAAAPDEEVNGITVSYFDDIVDYVCAHPADFDIYWHPDALELIFLGNPYSLIRFGDDFFDNLKEYVLANYYTTPSPSGGTVIINGHTWYATPYTDTNGYYTTGSTTNSGSGSADVTVYYSIYRVGTRYYDVWCTWSTQVCYLASRITPSFTQFSIINGTYSYDGQTYYCSNTTMSYRPTNSVVDFYSSYDEARADFYGNFDAPSSEPVSNGKVYIRDDPLGGNTLNFSLPAYPVGNSKAVSNYYYNTYGDTWEDNSEVNEIVYNNNNTTLYPVTYDNNIPLWLIQSNSSIETFDYSLELPSAPLETLPSDFEGGGSFFQNSFVVLGGFGAFVLVGLSFSLVGLFFKE